MDEILLLALLMLVCQCASRRQLDKKTASAVFEVNFRLLLEDEQAAVTCADNMNHVLEQVDPADLERLAANCTRALNARKVLRKYKYGDHLVVAVDGTQMFAFSARHCPHCLTRTLSNGQTEYYHYVLAAKVVTPVGLVLPVAFEFVENPDGQFDKQDCETKAFRRLAPRLRRLLGRTRLILVGDGLYAQEPVMDICQRYGWSWIITLKDQQLPTLQEQIARARQGRPVTADAGQPRVRATCGRTEYRDLQEGRHGVVDWVTPLRYHGRVVHVIELTETQEGKPTYHNVWITDLKPNPRNARALAQTGRLRWKIENEGTNTQKHGGYRMEHGYGVKGHAWKNYYLLTQIAQLLNDLFRLGDLPAKLTGDAASVFAGLYGSVEGFAATLIESLRNQIIRPPAGLDPGSIQIRLPDPPPHLALA